MTGSTWIGQNVGDRYHVESLLGRGGMSTVYRATDTNLGRVVAIKVIHPHLSDNPEFVRRFEEEAKAVAQLRHPNIIQVYDFNHEDDAYYIVFEFVPGETLQDRLKRLRQNERPMDVAKAVNIAAGIADALQYAHERRLIHRDVKPANVMLNVFGEPILMDFGIVKIVGGTQHTATGAVMGTARYMSPEQIQGTQVDERSDLYSLGVLLYEMVGGRAPFEADSAMTVMMMHVNDPVPDLDRLRPEISADVKRIIERALSKKREDRFQSAGEMAAALRAASVQAPAIDTAAATLLDAPVTPPPAKVKVPDPTPTPPREAAATTPSPQEPYGPLAGNRLLVGGAGGLLLLLLVLGVFFVPRLMSSGAEATATDGAALGAAPPGANSAEGDGTTTAESGAGAAITGPTATATLAPATATATLEPSATPEPDQDGDGVPDAGDDCPEQAAGTTPDPERPGCPLPPTDTPEPTATATPTMTPTPTLPPGPQVRIQRIDVQDNRYLVYYETYEYQEQLPGMHVHFFFNTVPPENAGNPASGPWYLWGGPRPFDGYTVGERPAAATEMCALVANPDHSVIANSGNCVPLP